MRFSARAATLVCSALVLACSRAPEPSDSERPAPASSPVASEAATAPSAPSAGSPGLLYLPDGGDTVQFGVAPEPGLLGPLPMSKRCPGEMVDVRGRFCIDRYEASLVDRNAGRQLSPYYHPTRAQTIASFNEWTRKAEGAPLGVPAPPEFQLLEDFEPRAEVKAGVTPSGYLNANLAQLACENAGKRLCSLEEWVLACRGEAGRKFPYGDRYQEGRCNVFREAHPAQLLHGDASSGHLDPRLNLVEGPAGPLLRKTGATETCRSVWGDDAAYDMVGNLDEWVSAPEGAFLGGFYARATREGCDSKVSSHPRSYFDYSLGVRCCR